MQRSCFLLFCTSEVPRIVFKTHLAKEKICVLFCELNQIGSSDELNGYFLHVFETNLVYHAFSLSP